MAKRNICREPEPLGEAVLVENHSDAWLAGQKAFIDGLPFECPFSKSVPAMKRQDWFAGWLDARTAERLAKKC